MRFYWRKQDLCGLYWPEWFDQVIFEIGSCFTGLYSSCIDVTWFLLVLLGFTGFYRILLGFTEFYWVLQGVTGFYWVLLGFATISD